MTQFFEIISILSNPTAIMTNGDHQKVIYLNYSINFHELKLLFLKAFSRVRESQRVGEWLEGLCSNFDN
jgi:hypothetical protein